MNAFVLRGEQMGPVENDGQEKRGQRTVTIIEINRLSSPLHCDKTVH